MRAPASLTSRATSTPSSTRKRSRCAVRGAPTTSSRSRRSRVTWAEGYYEYNLDFPGSALDPGCDYELWARRVTAGTEPTVYAHVVARGRPARPARAAVLVLLPVQRLEQQARGRLGDDPARLRRRRTPREALAAHPLEVGYSQHEGAERAAWGDEKLERRRRDAPGRLSGRGLARELLSTTGSTSAARAEQGVGCDDTDRAPRRAAARRRARSRATPRRRRRRTPGSRSRAAGESGSRRSTTARPGPNLKPQWTDADHVVRGLARPELRQCPPAGRSGQRRDRLLLRRGRMGLESGAASTCRQPRRQSSPGSRCSSRFWSSCANPYEVAPDDASASRASARVGADPDRLVADVRVTPSSLPRPSACVALPARSS